jgi:hypothetical protein
MTATKPITTPVPPRRTAPAPFFPVEELVEFELVELEPVPLSFIASAWKASKLLSLDSTAFAEKTMPWPQWVAWRQYAQIGDVSFTWIVYVGNVVALEETGILNGELCRVSAPERCVRFKREQGHTIQSQSQPGRL